MKVKHTQSVMVKCTQIIKIHIQCENCENKITYLLKYKILKIKTQHSEDIYIYNNYTVVVNIKARH